MKKLLLIAAFIVQVTSGVCQQSQLKPFTIEGSINVDTGELELSMVGDSSFYPTSTRHFKAEIIKGKFSFNGKIPHAMGYQMLTKDNKYLSETIVIEPGAQSMVCNVDSSRKLPQIDNQSMKEFGKYRAETSESHKKSVRFDLAYSQLRKQYPNGIPEDKNAASEIERQSLYDEGDRNLLNFVTENPGSYWALWRLISLTDFGYEKIFDKILPQFTDSIRNSYAGKRLAVILKKSGVLSVGKKFPEMELRTINGNKSPAIKFGKGKYTLVDFWYTNCAPCIARFPSYVKVYDRYHSTGFEIACIATDALKYGKDLPVVIKKHNLKWLHYWDVNGKGATALSVLAFPTNFLVDADGNILQKNISGAELAIFLQKHL